MRHSVLGPVNLTFGGSTLQGSFQCHERLDWSFRKQDTLRVDPRKALGVREHELRLTKAGKYWHHPRVPRTATKGVGDAGSVRRKGGKHLGPSVMSKLDRDAIGKQLYVDLAFLQEPLAAPFKREHASVS